jgi:hypothetical protein
MIQRFAVIAMSLLIAAATPTLRAQHFFQASDLPRLADSGLILNHGGVARILVWDRSDRTWSISRDGQVLTLKAGSISQPDNPPAPAWSRIDTLDLPANQPIWIRIKGANFDPISIGGNYRSGESKVERPPYVPLPAAIALLAENEPEPDMNLVRGRIDSTRPSEDARRTQARTNHEGVNFEPPDSPESWYRQASALREQLQVTLGLFPELPRCELNARVFGKIERDGYTIEKAVIETLPGFFLAGNIYRPASPMPACKRPGLLSPHGHWSDGRVNPEVQPRCVHWARLGAVVFMYDMVGYNDSGSFKHEFLNDRLKRWGLSLPMLQTWNSLRAVDFLASLPDVDATRIGCTGESGGGTQTFLLAALEPRIQAAAPVVMVSENFQGGCGCENAAGLRHGIDNRMIAALAAPRPMILVGATGDWTANTLTKVLPPIRRVYESLGSSGRVTAELFDFPHNYNQTSRNAVYRFLAPHLLGPDLAHDKLEESGELPVEKPEDLRVFNEINPPPAETKTPKQLENWLVTQASQALESLAPGSNPAMWQATRQALARVHAIRTGLRAVEPMKMHAVREATNTGATQARHFLLQGERRGSMIPVVEIHPAAGGSGTDVILMHPRGKAGLTEDSGKPTPLVEALLKRGHRVVGFDPLFVGESFDPEAPATRGPKTDHALCYNPSLAEEHLRDLAAVLKWSVDDESSRATHLLGLEGAGPLALLVRPGRDGIGRTSVDLSGFDYGDGSGDVPASSDLPGVCQFGGLAMAAALAAPEPLWIQRPGDAFRTAWPEAAYALSGSRSSLRIQNSAADPDALADWLTTGDWPSH